MPKEISSRKKGKDQQSPLVRAMAERSQKEQSWMKTILAKGTDTPSPSEEDIRSTAVLFERVLEKPKTSYTTDDLYDAIDRDAQYKALPKKVRALGINPTS